MKCVACRSSLSRSLMLGIAVVFVYSDATAGMTWGWFALHRKDKFSATKSILQLCDNPATPTVEPNYSPNYDQVPCNQYTVQAPVPASSQVYLVVGNVGPDGVAGASMGIDYSGSSGRGIDPEFTTWTSCTDGVSYPMPGPAGDWPRPQSGLRVTWNTCQATQFGLGAVVGSFYVYAYSGDILSVTPNNRVESGPELALGDCNGGTTDFLKIYPDYFVECVLGKVGFGDQLGHRVSCVPDPVHPLSWGRLKNTYHN